VVKAVVGGLVVEMSVDELLEFSRKQGVKKWKPGFEKKAKDRLVVKKKDVQVSDPVPVSVPVSDWGKDDDLALKELFKSGKTIAEIAEEMHKDVKSLYYRARKLGLERHHKHRVSGGGGVDV